MSPRELAGAVVSQDDGHGIGATSDPSALARVMIENAADGIFHLDAEGRTTFANAAAEAMFGWSMEELAGRKLHDMLHYRHADGSPFPIAECPLGRVFESGETLAAHEDLFFRKDGSEVSVACSNAAIRSDDGHVLGSVLIVRDVTDRKRAEEHRQLLLNELNHRVRNTLSMVQSIAWQTFRKFDDKATLRIFEERLGALSAAHNVLTEEVWQAAPILAILERALKPFRADPVRIQLSGPDAKLEPRGAIGLALAIHELATNAAKYGALSVDGGRVDVSWEITPGAEGLRLHILWIESGGPTVTPPSRRGFGSRMIERALADELGGRAILTFDPAGVRFALDAPYLVTETTA